VYRLAYNASDFLTYAYAGEHAFSQSISLPLIYSVGVTFADRAAARITQRPLLPVKSSDEDTPSGGDFLRVTVEYRLTPGERRSDRLLRPGFGQKASAENVRLT
jgi:hypothetical protein